MEIKKEERIRLTDTGYRRICDLVDRRAAYTNGDVLTCEWCGRTNGGFQHHHIRFRSAYGSDTLENLILLCCDCHESKAHGSHSKSYRLAFQKRVTEGTAAMFNALHGNEADAIYKKYRKG